MNTERRFEEMERRVAALRSESARQDAEWADLERQLLDARGMTFVIDDLPDFSANEVATPPTSIRA